MALTPAKIHVGPCRIWGGVTVATTGTPPTYTTHTDGVPATGTELGATLGDLVIKVQLVKELIEIEQHLAPVDLFTKALLATVTFVCLEQTYYTLQMAFDNIGKETQSGGDAFWFGGGVAELAPITPVFMFTSRQRNAPTKFICTQLYKAASMDGAEFPMSKSKATGYKVSLTALADLTRNIGDQVGYYRFEK